MSWDLYVFDLPKDLKSLDDLPKTYKPSAEGLGLRSEIIAQILDVAPEADFTDPSWGLLAGEDWSIEFSMGDKERVDCIAFHVRGDDGAVGALGAIAERLDMRVYDVQAGDFFKAGPDAVASFHAWKGYREQALSVVGRG